MNDVPGGSDVVYISSGDESELISDANELNEGLNYVNNNSINIASPVRNDSRESSTPINVPQNIKSRLDSLFDANKNGIPSDVTSRNDLMSIEQEESNLARYFLDTPDNFTSTKKIKISDPYDKPLNNDSDDLEIIEEEEAVKKSKFKKTSFDAIPMNQQAGDIGKLPIGQGNNSASSRGENGKYFNNPVAIANLPSNPEAVKEVKLQRAIRSMYQHNLNEMELLKQQAQIVNNLRNVILQTSHIELELDKYRQLRSDIKSDKTSTDAEVNQINEKIISLSSTYHSLKHSKERCEVDLKNLNARISFVRVLLRQLKSEIHELEDDKNYENDNDEDDELEIISESHANNERNFVFNSYYTPNIYSSDSVDLQNLLNNIQPEEEVDEEGLENTPPELSVTLLRHQRIGLSWLKRMEHSNSKGSILADDMGLGKTVQSIALILAEKPDSSECKTTMIVAPVSLLRQWFAELELKINPAQRLKIGFYHGSEKKELTAFRKIKDYDVLLTSYGTLSSEWKKHYGEVLKEARVKKSQNVIPDINSGGARYTSPLFSGESIFFRVILDECQNIKNKSSVASRAVYCVKAKFRLCLSGTPIQNNVDELFPALRFLRIKPYNDEETFRKDLILPLKVKSNNYSEIDKKKAIQKLRALLRAILLRRTKDTKIDGKPILSLPEKIIDTVDIKMDQKEFEYYKSLESGIQSKAKSLLVSNKSGLMSNILTLLLRLRQACCHSFLVEVGEMRLNKTNRSYIGSRKSNWQQMYKNVLNFDSSVTQRVKHVFESTDESNASEDTLGDGIFTCPICLDVVNNFNSVLFPKCGHIICDNCVDTYFERYETGDAIDDNKIAFCYACRTTFKRDELVSYDIFHKVVYENYDFDKLSALFSSISNRTTSSNGELMSQLIEKNHGMLPSAKMTKCIELLCSIKNTYPDEKIIVFSQFTLLFDLMKLELDKNNINFLRYDGTMAIENKNSTIRKFYQTDIDVLLISLRAGNVGLTLTCASHVIIMDPFWNPYVEEQAMDRAHRIGQQRKVMVYRLLIEGTIESRIMKLQNEKKELISGALDENGLKSVSRLGKKELGFLFGISDLK